MTVEDLIYELQNLDPNTEVRFASQPNYPFEYSINELFVVDVEKRGGDKIHPIIIKTLLDGTKNGPIILCDDNYIVGEKSKSYRLTDTYQKVQYILGVDLI